MNEAKCPFCGKTAKVSECTHNTTARWDGVVKYTVTCSHCFAKAEDGATEEEALQNWLDGRFTKETLITQKPFPYSEYRVSNGTPKYKKHDNALTVDDLDTEACVRLASAIIGNASDDYLELWRTYLKEKARFDAMAEKFPDVHERYEERLKVDDAWNKVKGRNWHPDYKRVSKRYEYLNKQCKLDKVEAKEYYDARADMGSAKAATDRVEEFFKTTGLLNITSVTPESIITTLRHRGERKEADVKLNVRPGGDVVILFQHGSYKPFGFIGGYVYIELVNDKLYVWNAKKRDNYKTAKILPNNGHPAIITGKKDIVEWASTHDPSCSIKHVGFMNKYLID